jgi:hypothetical protein
MIFPTACQPGGGECEQCPGCPVRLDIAHDPATNNRVLLQWSTAFPGYNLLANTIVDPLAGYVPIGPAPVVVSSKFTVTNVISAPTNRFYLLRKP